MNSTAHLNVIDGTITIDPPAGWEDTDACRHNGVLLGLCADGEPWGVDEESLDRADVMLAGMGWRRDGEWGGSEFYTAAVTPA